MKKLLLVALMLLFPISTIAGERPESWWFCYQVGVMKYEVKTKRKTKVKEKNTLAITHIFSDNVPNHYEDREEQFAETVEYDTDGKFEGHFEPQCVDYSSADCATKHMQKKIERAKSKKRNYDILLIHFNYHPPEEKG